MRPQSRNPYISLSNDRGAHRAPAILPRALAPLVVRFVEQTDTDYAVGELRGPRTALVPKQRAVAARFPPVSRLDAPGRRLLLWSVFALIGVGLGGIGGIVLGGLVVVVALLRLARFSGKVHRWRRVQRARGEQVHLPAAATSERLCLLAALGQGLVAAAAGALVVLFLTGFL